MELYAFRGGKCVTEGKLQVFQVFDILLYSEGEVVEQLEIDWVSLLQYFEIKFIE